MARNVGKENVVEEEERKMRMGVRTTGMAEEFECEKRVEIAVEDVGGLARDAVSRD